MTKWGLFYVLHRKVNMYKIASGFEYEHYGTYLTTRTLKDVSSIAEIALSSGQLWDKTQKDKYMANTITSVMVSLHLRPMIVFKFMVYTPSVCLIDVYS